MFPCACVSAFPPCRASVLALYSDQGLVSEVTEGQRCSVLLDRTCFYAEQGGQMHDSGYFTKDGLQVSLTAAVMFINDFQQKSVLSSNHQQNIQRCQNLWQYGAHTNLHPICEEIVCVFRMCCSLWSVYVWLEAMSCTRSLQLKL